MAGAHRTTLCVGPPGAVARAPSGLQRAETETRLARGIDGYTERHWLTLEPSTQFFPGRVFLLTSGATASAAEILVLASMQVPSVVRIGAATEGIFSDSLDKTLPNGWEYTLSNEVYETPTSESFEGSGIPPHHPIAYPRDARAFYLHLVETAPAGDAAIETALRLSRRAADTDPASGAAATRP